MNACPKYVVLQRLPVSGENTHPEKRSPRHAMPRSDALSAINGEHITLLLHELAFHKAHFGASDEQATIGKRLIHQRTIEADCR
jgi:hypothetical protein